LSVATAIRCPCGACFDGCYRNESQAIVLGEQLKTFFEWKKATLRSSQCRPTSPIRPGRAIPSGMRLESHTEGGAPGEWARYRLGSYTIIDRQDWGMDFRENSIKF
jgi:hypothetical protein